MKLALQSHEFLRAPVGACIAGPTYLMWCAAPDLVGTIQWGTPEERDVHDMLAIADAILRSSWLAPAGCLLMDCSEIERVDPDVMVAVAASVRDLLPRWSPRILRHAVVVPSDVRGILLSGALPMVAPSHAFQFSPNLDSALTFLGHAGGAEAHAAASEIANQVRGSSRLVSRLREVLLRDLVEASVDRSAMALGLSPRTLQRELARCGTSFSDELRRARVGVARDLLVTSDAKVESIAARVGFGSASRMSVALRRELGATAGELRERARK